MTDTIKNRIRLTAQVGILIAPFLGIGSAIAYAGEPSEMIIEIERPATIESTAMYRDEVQAGARIIVWKTRYNVLSDLELKLNNEQPSTVRLAGNFTDKRG